MNIRIIEIVVCKQQSKRNNFITSVVISNIQMVLTHAHVHVLKVPREI